MSLARRKVFIAVAVLAVIGAIVGIIVWQTGSKSSDKATSGSGNNSGSSSNNSTSGGSTTTSPSTGADTQPSTGAGNSSDAGSSSGFSDGAKKSTITSDPTKAKYSVNMYAIGDWGTTVTRDSCCKRRGDHTPTNVDKNAEDLVAKVMGMAAASTDLKPKVVIGHGDNFYWGGLMGKTDQAYRFDKTFESKFNAKSLEGIPWINVLGNHDYGGASFVCSSGSDYVKCGSTAELLAALDAKFTLQSSYVSPNGNRWITKDHFFVHTIEDAASGVTIDIFNMDTNDADSHGAHQICCQCYGYSSGSSKCNDVHVGDAWCAGGDVGMYNACMDKISAWGKDSRDQFKKLVAKSTATWKIVNTHYSPYNHYAEAKQDMWWELLKDSGIQLYISGHTHGEKHDYSKYGIHFILNGAGGGILNEAADDVPEYARKHVKKVWQYPTYDYGFFELKASKEWLRASFLTNDAAWNVADDFSQSTVGGVATKHCWYIPVDGTEGKACTAAS